MRAELKCPRGTSTDDAATDTAATDDATDAATDDANDDANDDATDAHLLRFLQVKEENIGGNIGAAGRHNLQLFPFSGSGRRCQLLLE